MDAVHGVVGIVAGVIFRACRDHRAIDLRLGSGAGFFQNAAQKATIRVEGETESFVDETVVRPALIKRRRNHIGGQAELAVTGGVEKIQLAAAPAHQHVRTGDIGATGQIKTNKWNFAGAVEADAAGINHTLRHGEAVRPARQPENGCAEHRRHTGLKTLSDKFPARARTAVVAVAQGLIQLKKSALSHGSSPLTSTAKHSGAAKKSGLA